MGREMHDYPFEANTPARHLSRRTIIGFLLTGLAAGCTKGGRLPPALASVEKLVTGDKGAGIDREWISNLPYATISARIGSGPNIVLVLAKIDDGNLHWVSSDRGLLVTRGGYLVKTYGLPSNVASTRFETLSHKDAPISASSRITNVRFIDLSDDQLYGVRIDSAIRPAGSEIIDIYDVRIECDIYEEVCRAPTLDWNFVNRFWLEKETGRTWRSIQYIAPSLPPVTLELLKPASA